MPDIHAHMRFAYRVLEAADFGIVPTAPAVCLGCFGPDPLFNDILSSRRAQGFGAHKRPGAELLEAFRRPVCEERPSCAELAAGFFTHYALDRLCHPEVNRLAATGRTTHLAIESRCEQMLRAEGAPPLPRVEDFSDADMSAACIPYRGMDAWAYRRDVGGYLAIRRFVNGNAGNPLSRLPGLIHEKLDGFIARTEPTQEELDGAYGILRTLERCVPIAAEQLVLYMRALRTGGALNEWTRADFSGSCV